jgi:hypothetical protein
MQVDGDSPIVSGPWAHLGGESRNVTESGFTLIELIIVALVLPLVIGAITLALISVFSLQSGVSGRLSDSGNAQIVSANFNSDIQGASLITTDSASPPNGPAPCETSAQAASSDPQVLGLQWGSGATGTPQTEVSYVEAPSGSVHALIRNVCQILNTTPVTTSFVSGSVVSSDVPSGETATLACTTSAASECANTAPSNLPLYQSSWVSTTGVTGVTIQIVQGGLTKYSYTLVATPRASSPANNEASTAATPNSSCNFATPGTGTYVSSLCFVDFSPWATLTAPIGESWSCNASGTPAGALAVAAPIANTPYTLDFCLSVSSVTSGGAAITGSVSSTDPGEGSTSYSGYNGVVASALPTYYSPPASEAFLGNNGFYTGVAGDPALYTVTPAVSTVTITQIQVIDGSGDAASDWELVSGDAESTDNNPESMKWTAGWNAQSTVPASNQVLNVLPNSSTSTYGNACPGADGVGGGDLTGAGTQTVTCGALVPSDKTGTLMLEAQQPTSLTAVMSTAGGRQAIFLGLLLPS